MLKGYNTKLVLYTYDSFLLDLCDEEEHILQDIRKVFKEFKLNIKEKQGYDYSFAETGQYV
jgi:hypothetical protein